MNKTWDEFILRMLYGNVYLGTAAQLHSFLASLKEFPERAKLVASFAVAIHCVHFHIGMELDPVTHALKVLFGRHLKELKHLEMCELSYMTNMFLLKQCLRGKIALTRLIIQSTRPTSTDTSPSFIASIMTEFTHLEDLWVEISGSGGGGGKFAFCGCLSHSIDEDNTTLPALKRIGICSVVKDDHWATTIRRVCPNLKRLEINGMTRFPVT